MSTKDKYSVSITDQQVNYWQQHQTKFENKIHIDDFICQIEEYKNMFQLYDKVGPHGEKIFLFTQIIVLILQKLQQQCMSKILKKK